ncbi:MAG: hypothetical protein ACRC22_05740, partial [Shewanella sp.]
MEHAEMWIKHQSYGRDLHIEHSHPKKLTRDLAQLFRYLSFGSIFSLVNLVNNAPYSSTIKERQYEKHHDDDPAGLRV